MSEFKRYENVDFSGKVGGNAEENVCKEKEGTQSLKILRKFPR